MAMETTFSAGPPALRLRRVAPTFPATEVLVSARVLAL